MNGVESMIDINKQYTTRDGGEVRIYCTDGGGEYPVHGAILNRDGTWQSWEWTIDGLTDTEEDSPYDLIEVPPRIKGWVNIYPSGQGWVCSSREDADASAHSSRIACIEIDVPHGHGLEVK